MLPYDRQIKVIALHCYDILFLFSNFKNKKLKLKTDYIFNWFKLTAFWQFPHWQPSFVSCVSFLELGKYQNILVSEAYNTISETVQYVKQQEQLVSLHHSYFRQ